VVAIEIASQVVGARLVLLLLLLIVLVADARRPAATLPKVSNDLSPVVVVGDTSTGEEVAADADDEPDVLEGMTRLLLVVVISLGGESESATLSQFKSTSPSLLAEISSLIATEDVDVVGVDVGTGEEGEFSSMEESSHVTVAETNVAFMSSTTNAGVSF